MAFALTVTFTLASCVSQQSDEPPKSLRNVVKIAATPRDELTVASDALTAQCMNRHGFRVPTPGRSVYGVRVSITGYVGLFDSVQHAREYGYGSTILSDKQAPIDLYRASLSKQERKRFDAVEYGDRSKVVKVRLSNGAVASKTTGGCAGSALAAIYGSVRDELEVEVLQNEVLTIAAESSVRSTIEAHLPEYRKCMAGAGIGVSGLDAAATVEGRYGAYRRLGDPPSAAEARIAVADATCQSTAGLEKSGLDALYRSGGQWFKKHRVSITRVSGIVREATARADAVRAGLH